MAWHFALCDLAGVAIGEVYKASDRTLSLPLNGLPTASFKLRLDDALADQISSRNADCLVKVYQDSTLRFIGDVTTVEEVAQDGEQSIQVNAAGPLWRLQKRLIGTGFFGLGEFTRSETAANTIITDMLTAVNTTNAAGIVSDTGIRAGTLSALYKTSVGPWRFKPMAEALTEMQTAKIAYPVNTPPSFVAQETFTLGVNGSAINGRSDGLGNTWASAGSGPDWILQSASGYGYRTSSNDGGARWAINSAPAHGAVVAAMDHISSERSATGNYLNFHLYTRLTTGTPGTAESGNWIRVSVNYDTTAGSVTLQKKIGATTTTIGTYNFSGTWIEANVWYAVRLLVDDDGNYSVWHYQPANWSLASPVILGHDADFASAGTLATGSLAFGDLNISGVNTQRSFDNISASTYTGPLSFDFELAPLDLGVAGETDVAALNVTSPQIGTTRANAIFEYGTGGRTVKSYTRKTDRQGQINQAWSLNPAFPDPDEGWTVADIRSATDATAITARGLFEEVVQTDAVDGQLRQAWVESNVAVRNGPRQLITFEPSENAPVFGTDFTVGDTVTGRAIVNGTVRFNATFRVYGVEISVDDEGKAVIVPTLTVE